MPCYSPLTGYRARKVNPETGKRSITFKPKDGYLDQKQEIACGQCIGCRLERSRQWAIRCMHEAQMHQNNCFITVTYNDQWMPKYGSLHKPDFQNFLKKLRNHKNKFRYYYCGEYGEKLMRPHYHACLFGIKFEDKKLWTQRDGIKLYVSEQLTNLWGKGHVTLGDVTFESAAYTARYVTKKITGYISKEHYQIIDKDTGEIKTRTPEYTDMSRRPGIGKPWLDKYKTDVYPHDYVIQNGKKIKPPKFYDKQLEKINEQEYRKIKQDRVNNAKTEKNVENNTQDRLQVRETIQKIKAKQLKRSYENEDL